MRLSVVHHLQPVLDHAESIICLAEHLRFILGNLPRCGQCIERRTGPAKPQARIATAVDQLMRLSEKFDFANSATPGLEVEPGARFFRPRMIGADSHSQLPNFLDRAKIQAAAPDERTDRGEEFLACGNIARRCPSADEGGALPCQRRAFVMRQRSIAGNRQWADFGCGTQAQIDPEDIAFLGVLAQQSHHFARIALRGFARFVAFAAR